MAEEPDPEAVVEELLDTITETTFEEDVSYIWHIPATWDADVIHQFAEEMALHFETNEDLVGSHYLLPEDVTVEEASSEDVMAIADLLGGDDGT